MSEPAFLDFETRSAVDLRKSGAHVYASSPTTSVLCAAYAFGDAPVRLWRQGEPCPDDLRRHVENGGTIYAFNASFERAIWDIMHARHGWPLPRPEQWRCLMAQALAAALPGSLAGAAEALGLPAQKDDAGRRLMLSMAKPRKPRRDEDPSGVYWHDGPVERARLEAYCAQDTEVERALFHRSPPLSEAEQSVWLLSETINSRGVFVDTELAEAARTIVQAEAAAIDAELAELTGGVITSVNQVGKLAALLRERGHDVTSVTKQSVREVLAAQPAEDVQRILALRQAGGLSAARKLDSLLAGADHDQRLRGGYRYCGAATGR
jgi:DNA polymerase bacteriophage-type